MNCDTNDIWDKLYASAKSVRGARKVSPFIEAGAVAAAILTKSGNIHGRLHRHTLFFGNVRRTQRDS